MFTTVLILSFHSHTRTHTSGSKHLQAMTPHFLYYFVSVVVPPPSSCLSPLAQTVPQHRLDLSSIPSKLLCHMHSHRLLGCRSASVFRVPFLVSTTTLCKSKMSVCVPTSPDLQTYVHPAISSFSSAPPPKFAVLHSHHVACPLLPAHC